MTVNKNGCNYAVIWDMDGTLVDTSEEHYQSFLHALPEVGLTFDRETFQKMFGMNNAAILEGLLGYKPSREIVDRVSERKETFFRELLHGRVKALPGVEDWLKRNQAAGIPQAIASSAPQENIDATLDELGFCGYFQAILTAYALPSKPDPAVFLEAARQLGCPPERCIVVEDGLAGVQGAKNAGMKCVAVTNTNPAETLAVADVVVDSLEHLPPDGFARLVYNEPNSR